MYFNTAITYLVKIETPSGGRRLILVNFLTLFKKLFIFESFQSTF